MKILMIVDGTVSGEIRLLSYKDRLSKFGYNILAASPHDFKETKDLPRADVLIISRPYAWQIIDIYKARGTRVIADMDDDFWSIDKNHPGYNGVGPGNPDFISAVEKSLEMVDDITVSSAEMKQRMERFGHPTHIIKNGWDDSNMLWYRPKYKLHKPIIIGWAGTITHRDDFKQVITPITTITRKYPDVGIMIGGDPNIYDKLEKIPLSNKWFIPTLPYKYYPAMLSYLDIGLVPLVDTQFNRAKSDIKLLEMSAKALSVVASPVPPYNEWDDALFARSENEWIENIEALIVDANMRRKIGEKLSEKALERTFTKLTPEWVKVLK